MEITGKDIDHYQGMTHGEMIKLIQWSISKVMKGRPRQEVDDTTTGIITDKGEETDSNLLDWTKSNERTKTNQQNNELNNEKSLRPEHVKIIKQKSKSGG